MRRRAFLASLAAGAGSGALAGCVAPTATDRDSAGTPEDTLSTAELGYPGTICEEALPADPGIYAVLDPAFAPDWSDHATPGEYGDLTEETVVIGLDRDGRARAYPLPVLRRHEAVNDRLGGPVVVTYCPLCLSGMVASRRVGGSATEFLVSGLLWSPPELQTRIRETEGTVFGVDRDGETGVRQSGNLVLYDRATRSYWSQVLAAAICGPREGVDLSILPSTVATWGEWRREHPGTGVLLPPPHSGTARPGDGSP